MPGDGDFSSCGRKLTAGEQRNRRIRRVMEVNIKRRTSSLIPVSNDDDDDSYTELNYSRCRIMRATLNIATDKEFRFVLSSKNGSQNDNYWKSAIVFGYSFKEEKRRR